MSRVSLIIGSTSDREIGNKAEAVLKEFGVDYDYQVYSAHRNPKALREYIEASDASVYIAVAGLSWWWANREATVSASLVDVPDPLCVLKNSLLSVNFTLVSRHLDLLGHHLG